MTETLVRVEAVSKRFCVDLKRSLWYGLQDLGRELTGRRHRGGGTLRPQEFWAVRDVGFELRRGECLGLIGHNGAGKTTLLRMLNGLIKPDSGRIELRGQVGALIALGAGFNPILTGRENIYISASILGMRKQEVDRKLDEIVDFAEIGPFLDMPVRNYSSGMNVRLGFSVAAILLRPDVLLLDEVLAVGDIGFLIKCLRSIRRLAQQAAVVLVSHNMSQISSFSTRVLVMDHGRAVLDTDDVAEGIDRYYALVERQPTEVGGAGGARVLGFEVSAEGVPPTDAEPSLAAGSLAVVTLHVEIDPGVLRAGFVLKVFDATQSPIVHCDVHGETGEPLRLSAGRHTLRVPLGPVDLATGRYSFVVVVRDVDRRIVLTRVQGLGAFRVVNERSEGGARITRAVVAHVASSGAVEAGSPTSRA